MPVLPCRFAAVPSNKLEQLFAREQEIGQLEALTGFLGPWNHPEVFKAGT